MKIIFLFLFSLQLWANPLPESMKEMPILKEDHVYIVTGQENFLEIMGFGKEEPKVKMMNLMMVEGSGFEGMEHH